MSSCFGKILEYIIVDRCRTEMTGRLSEYQYGFRPGRSTVDAVQRVKEMVSVAKEEKNWCVMIAIDIRNAFNTAPWPGIIEASSRLGIPPYLLNVFIDYLSDREIVIDDTSLFMSKGSHRDQCWVPKCGICSTTKFLASRPGKA